MDVRDDQQPLDTSQWNTKVITSHQKVRDKYKHNNTTATMYRR